MAGVHAGAMVDKVVAVAATTGVVERFASGGVRVVVVPDFFHATAVFLVTPVQCQPTH